MEYFILNEQSLPISSAEKIDSCMVQFFEIYKEAAKNNFKHIRVSDNVDAAWYEISIGEDKSLREWVMDQSSDYSRRLKSLITSTQCPLYDPSQVEEKDRFELSEFNYEGKEVPNLGAAFLLNQLSFSFDSDEIWDRSLIHIDHTELTIEEELVDNLIEVRNVTNIEHWTEHYSIIERLQIEAVGRAKEIIENLNLYFPNIEFTGSAMKQLNNNRFTPTFMAEVWNALKSLNTAVAEIDTDISYENVISKSGLNISDESSTVKQNPRLRRHRLFMYQDEQHFFGYHVKNFRNQERIHFIIHDNKVVVGYIGKHLPL